MLTRLALVAVATFLLNIPCGWWRQGVRRFSVPWFVFIHLPIPLVVLMRLKSGIGFAWYTYPIMIAAYFAGQFAGSRLRQWRIEQGNNDAANA